MEILLIHAAATWFMTGLIWFVQVVHYPLFDRVGIKNYVRYQKAHTRLTFWVVAPPMLVELTTGIGLLFVHFEGVSSFYLWVNLGLLVLLWLSTAMWQGRQHNALANGFDDLIYQRLVLSNWIRTIAWTARAILVCWLLFFI